MSKDDIIMAWATDAAKLLRARAALEQALAALQHVRSQELWIDQDRVIKPAIVEAERALRDSK